MYLLDTHTLLWYLRDTQDLSLLARQTIDNVDRVIIATALAGNLTIITRDKTIPKYPVNTLW